MYVSDGMYVYICVCMNVVMVCMYVCMGVLVCMFVVMVCMYVCMGVMVCMYVCMSNIYFSICLCVLGEGKFECWSS